MTAGTKPKRALVAGGGIAGLASALGLARAGWHVTVCEQADALREVGAGLQMSPNALRVLRWLGIDPAVEVTAFRPEAAEMRDGRTGEIITRVELGRTAELRWGAPYLHIHRADLMRVLAEAAVAAGVEIRTGARAVGYLNRMACARLRLADGATLEGELIVGADGIRSALRSELNGAEDPEFLGQVAWRGTLPAAWLPPGLVAPNATVWAGPGRHLVTYYLRGGDLVNFVAVEEREGWAEEGWSRPGDPDDLRAAFEGWHPQVVDLLAAVEETYLWGLFGRPEQVRWVEDRVALLGDAAHPMLPFMAQGAAMALEDVAVLLRALDRHEKVSEALLAWEEARWSRVTRVQAQSRSNGSLFHKRSAVGQFLAWTPIAAVTRYVPGLAAAQLDWLYGHDVLVERV